MLKKYTPDEFWDLYEKLPQDLQDALFSEHIAKQIRNIAERNNVDDADLTEIMGYVFLGIIRPERLQGNLEAELSLDSGKAKDVAQEIERFILYPLKSSLASILKLDYKPKTTSPKKEEETFHLPKTGAIPETPEISTDIEKERPAYSEDFEEEEKPAREDSYRESVD